MEETLTKLLTQLPGLIVSIAGAGPAGWIAGGVFLLVCLGGGLGLYFWLRRVRIDASNAQNEKQKQQDQAGIVGENQQIANGNQQAENEIDGFGRK